MLVDADLGQIKTDRDPKCCNFFIFLTQNSTAEFCFPLGTVGFLVGTIQQITKLYCTYNRRIHLASMNTKRSLCSQSIIYLQGLPRFSLRRLS
jgi:hypothetical protein